MEWAIFILIIIVIFVFVLPIMALRKAGEAERKVLVLENRLGKALNAIEALRGSLKNLAKPLEPPAESQGTGLETEPPDSVPLDLRTGHSNLSRIPPPTPKAPPPLPPPPLSLPVSQPLPEAGAVPLPEDGTVPVSVRGIAAFEEQEPPSEARISPPPSVPKLNLEQFLGVKLFAWLGGLALFFAIVFFLKYSFDHNLIPPAGRAAIGFILGAGLLVAGVIVHRKPAYEVLAQTFCASGALILYGVSYSAHSRYHLFGHDPQGALITFGLMALTTAAAFLIAVRLNTLVVAVMGILGGFLTPILCSTGQDAPFGLFGYIALLDLGLLLVARARRWFFLVSLAAAGTVLMQLGWFGRFFVREEYFSGNATLIPMGILLFFMILFCGAAWKNGKAEAGDKHTPGAALAMAGIALLAAFGFLNFEGITSRPFLLYGFVFLVNSGVLGVVALFPRFGWAQSASAFLTFTHLSWWTMQCLTPGLLGSALVIYLGFGLLHAGVPLVWQKLHEGSPLHSRLLPPWISALVVLLMLLPVLVMPEVSFLLWPAMLLADLGVIAVAVATGMLAPVLVALVLTLLVVLCWLLRVPAEVTALPSFLLLLGGFAAAFMVAGCWLARRYPGFLQREQGAALTSNDRVAASLPVLSAGLPFLLIIMATLRLPVANPSPVFGLGLLLVILLLGLARIARLPALSLVALVCMVALELAWHGRHFAPDHPWIPLAWYAGVHLLFTAYPFLFREAFRRSILPWAAAAASGIGHFLLIYSLVRLSFPALSGRLGLVPAAFAVPGIISLLGVLRVVKSEGGFRTGQLAWFGGVVLLFITLIFPIQLSRQWITVAWALEGAALLWLYRRVPQRGLIWTGLTLLAVVFFRLALNPAVLDAYPRGAIPILNWHLYTYGTAAACMMAAARWLQPPHDVVKSVNIRGVLWSLSGILLFLLLNIEIADYFTEPSRTFVTIEFDTLNLARDMATTVAWGLFSLGLLVTGFWCGAKGARYAGVGLLAITLLKLFLHDLASLQTFYRIGALVVVAVIALLASFLYQRFFDKNRNP